ncbi:MAG: hypothetical protein J6M53_06990 [Bacteroidaceae bacterium]|nr:hypothetical protein [Bacteroidaceae bacterium]
MRKNYSRPWMRPVSLYGECQAELNASGDDSEEPEADQTRRFGFEEPGAKARVIPFWDE